MAKVDPKMSPPAPEAGAESEGDGWPPLRLVEMPPGAGREVVGRAMLGAKVEGRRSKDTGSRQ